MLFARLQVLLAALWSGFLLCIAFVAAPSAFAVLERAQAGLLVGRLFALDAQVSLAAALLLLLMERRLARDASGTRSVFTVQLLLPAVALFCTVAGYYGLQPLLADARAGVGVASFGALHGASLAFFAIKGCSVLALAWFSLKRAS